MLVCVYIVGRNFQVSVRENLVDSAVIWTLFAIANIAIITGLVQITKNTVAHIASELDTSTSGIHHVASSGVTVVNVILTAATIVLLPILPQVLTDPAQRDLSVSIYCIVYGGMTFLIVAIVTIVTIYLEIIRIKVNNQLKLLKKQVNIQDGTQQQVLKELATRVRLISLILVSLELCSPILYITIGSKFRFHYEIMHVIVGLICTTTILAIGIYSKAPFVSFIWQKDSVIASFVHRLIRPHIDHSVSASQSDVLKTSVTKDQTKDVQPSVVIVDFINEETNQSNEQK